MKNSLKLSMHLYRLIKQIIDCGVIMTEKVRNCVHKKKTWQYDQTGKNTRKLIN